MQLLGFDITRISRQKALVPVADNRGGWIRVLESYPGAWQQNVTVDRDSVLSYHAVYACMTLIASDVAKLRVKLVERDDNGVWSELQNPAYDPVLRRPNHYQNRIQFWEYWILSKLTRGNTYVLKERDARGVVMGLYILDPQRVKPLVADNGDVFYDLSADNLSGIEQNSLIVPAREIIHDRMNCIFHPLVGTSPIVANGLAATHGLNIQNFSAQFFKNRAMPSGILTAPGTILETDAQRLKDGWEQNYGGVNRGRIAVLGSGLEYKPIVMTSVDAQLIEQLKLTAEMVCSTFHVPPYKIGIGDLPSYNNVQALNVEYYSQCLQKFIEDAELCLDEGLEMKPGLGTEFDLDGLLRMDSVTQVQAEREAVGAGIKSPNEARRRFDLPPVEGGESPYLQQQNFSLAALAKRDALADPFAPAVQPAPVAPSVPDEPDDDEEDVEADEFDERRIFAVIAKGAGLYATT